MRASLIVSFAISGSPSLAAIVGAIVDLPLAGGPDTTTNKGPLTTGLILPTGFAVHQTGGLGDPLLRRRGVDRGSPPSTGVNPAQRRPQEPILVSQCHHDAGMKDAGCGQNLP